jgi:hypothetical protein
VRESACRLPYEIVEVVIAHTAYDLGVLRACSLTCQSWYIVAVPHLHHTLTLGDNILGIAPGKLKPLSKLHQLGLMPLVKEIRVEQTRTWFVPQALSRRGLRYFSAFATVQTLVLEHLDIFRFIPGVERYFGHFSPTLRSIALLRPFCTPRQPSHFLSLFSNLDDVKIWRACTRLENPTIPDAELVPFSMPKQRGRLVLHDFGSVETWIHLIASGSDLRFHYMDLCNAGGCAPVLFEVCADTLETLRLEAPQFSATDSSDGE